MSYGVIYGMVDPETRLLRYVGQTVNFATRKRWHRSPPRKTDRTRCANWKRNLIARGLRPTVVVIAECDSLAELNMQEEQYIALFKAMSARLTNHQPGGGNHTMDDESRAKLSAANKGRTSSGANKGRKPSPEVVAKRAAANRAKQHKRSPEQRAKMSAVNKGQIPWNKGGAGDKISAQARANLSASKKGKAPWNKGKPGSQVAWNKGKRTGLVPWNKGKPNPHPGHPMSEEARARLSAARKGKPTGRAPWNKGKKRPPIAAEGKRP